MKGRSYFQVKTDVVQAIKDGKSKISQICQKANLNYPRCKTILAELIKENRIRSIIDSKTGRTEYYLRDSFMLF